MIHIHLIAIGRMGAGPENDLLVTYKKRLRWPFSLHEITLKKPPQDVASRKAAEAKEILSAIPTGAAVIALDERGKDMRSRDFAAKIENYSSRGITKLAIIIGGADGLDGSVTGRADLILGLSKLTWPHMLVRALIVEQLYRAQSILSGHPYHRQ